MTDDVYDYEDDDEYLERRVDEAFWGGVFAGLSAVVMLALIVGLLWWLL